MNKLYKEYLAYCDRPNRRVVFHYHFNEGLPVRFVFSFQKGVPDIIPESLGYYMQMSEKELADFLQRRKKAAWERLRQVPKY